MRIGVLGTAVATLIACNSVDSAPKSKPSKPAAPSKTAPAPAPAKPAPAKPAMHPITLDWKLARTATALELTYTVENTSDKPVVLLDRLYIQDSKGSHPAFDRAVVRPTDAPDTVAFTRGYVAPGMGGGVGGTLPPIARTLAPKEKVTDRASIPLPITAWHNFIRMAPPITGTPTKAILEISYIVGHEAWVTVELDKAKHQAPDTPFVTTLQLLRSEPQPIP